ncbi:MAG: hypothetical protein P8J85_06480, partial [Alphaproteobacteria bacterium]|nr:hypothetical protein [Alphaproteobacteria bacterium]
AMTWALALGTDRPLPQSQSLIKTNTEIKSKKLQTIFNTKTNKSEDISIFNRDNLKVGDKIQGPALIIEDETSTYVSDQFAAYINNLKYIELIAKGASI